MWLDQERGNEGIVNEQTINRVSFYVILGLSLFAMCLVIGVTVLVLLGRFTPSLSGNEGTPERLFKLTILLLIPSCLTFLATANWDHPRKVAKRLVAPAIFLVVAFSTLYYMEHLR